MCDSHSYDLFIIDTDAGVDDALCLALATKFVPAEKLIVSSVYGNVEVNRATSNISMLFSKMNLDLEYVVQGAAAALDGYFESATDIHGSDGLGGVTSTLSLPQAPIVALSDWLLDRPDAGRVKLLSIGPATNIPAYIDAFGPERIVDVTLMSGSIHDVGNIRPYAEFNLFNDPFAFNEVVNSGVSVNIVPLDLCRKIIFQKNHLDVLRKYGAISEILIPAHEFYMEKYMEWEGVEGCYPHDSIALMVSLFPELFYSAPARFEAKTEQGSRGLLLYKQTQDSNIRAFTGGKLKVIRDLFNTDNMITLFDV